MIFKCKIIKMKIVPKKSFLLLQSENNLGSSDGWLCWQGGSRKKRRRNHLLLAMSFKKRLGIHKGVIWLFWLPNCSGDDRPRLRPQLLLGTSEGEGTMGNIWGGSKWTRPIEQPPWISCCPPRLQIQRSNPWWNSVHTEQSYQQLNVLWASSWFPIQKNLPWSEASQYHSVQQVPPLCCDTTTRL